MHWRESYAYDWEKWIVPFPLFIVHQWIIVANGRVSIVPATEARAEEIRRAAGPHATKTLI